MLVPHISLKHYYTCVLVKDVKPVLFSVIPQVNNDTVTVVP